MAIPVQARPNTSNTLIGPDAQVINAIGTPARPTLTDSEASGFSMLAAVLEHMQSRLYASARADLLEMAQVTFVKGRMARLLYENGFKSVRSLSEADPKKDILPIMMSISGWKMRKIERDATANANASESEGQGNVGAEEMYRLKMEKLEEKLLRKAEVMVRSAGFIYEREVLRTADFEE